MSAGMPRRLPTRCGRHTLKPGTRLLTKVLTKAKRRSSRNHEKPYNSRAHPEGVEPPTYGSEVPNARDSSIPTSTFFGVFHGSGARDNRESSVCGGELLTKLLTRILAVDVSPFLSAEFSIHPILEFFSKYFSQRGVSMASALRQHGVARRFSAVAHRPEYSWQVENLW